ncbi:hypothetical protein [Methylibium sp. Pch-M]|uniref:hypothetical protein n=1 Tax=Methylibium sp. Pch-M TaxID=2082386 RepID=UPI001F5D928E|nr:hypothetical protein [Methylibium sp. Pch-M]
MEGRARLRQAAVLGTRRKPAPRQANEPPSSGTRSVSLFALDFGRADAESAGDIGTQIQSRMAASLQLALPLFILQVIVSTLFALCWCSSAIRLRNETDLPLRAAWP